MSLVVRGFWRRDKRARGANEDGRGGEGMRQKGVAGWNRTCLADLKWVWERDVGSRW
jgi:hypothetical protein